MMKVSHIFLAALLSLGSANALFAAKSNNGGGGNTSKQQYTFGLKKAKTGGFVGAEFGIGSAEASIPARFNGYIGGSNSGYVVVPLNVFGGYQWYLYDQPHYTIGVRVRGHIGYTNYNTTLTALFQDPISLTAHGIQYGAEAQFVWDFLDYMEHTVGMHIALIGFEGSTFFGSGVEHSSTANNNITLGTHSKFAYTIGIGLHYYYAENHQVYITHRYRTYSTFADFQSKYYSVANNVFSFGYAYKF